MNAAPPLLDTRSSLIQRLKATINGESWEEFFNSYWELIFHVARRAGLSAADSQDIVQETIVKVHKSLDGFQYNRSQGSFKGWLRAVTRSRLAEHFKKLQKRPLLHEPLDDRGRRQNFSPPSAASAMPAGFSLSTSAVQHPRRSPAPRTWA